MNDDEEFGGDVGGIADQQIERDKNGVRTTRIESWEHLVRIADELEQLGRDHRKFFDPHMFEKEFNDDQPEF